MFMSYEVTNPSLRAWGSIVVGSPSFAQRKVFACAAPPSATIATTAAIANRRIQCPFFMIRLGLFADPDNPAISAPAICGGSGAPCRSTRIRAHEPASGGAGFADFLIREGAVLKTEAAFKREFC